MTYEKPRADEWVQPVRHGYKMACCDCGLVHDMDFRVIRGRVQFRVRRNNRATAAKRRWKHLLGGRTMNVSTNCVVTLRVESPQTHESARKFAARIKAAIEFQVVGTSVTVVSTGSPTALAADADRQLLRKQIKDVGQGLLRGDIDVVDVVEWAARSPEGEPND